MWPPQTRGPPLCLGVLASWASRACWGVPDFEWISAPRTGSLLTPAKRKRPANPIWRVA